MPDETVKDANSAYVPERTKAAYRGGRQALGQEQTLDITMAINLPVGDPMKKAHKSLKRPLVLSELLRQTGRRGARLKLSKTERQVLLRTIELAPIGIAYIDLNGYWLLANQIFCEQVGYTRDELAQLTYTAITLAEDYQSDLENNARLLKGELPRLTRERRYVRKDGSRFWVRLTTVLIRSVGGSPRYFMVFTEDVSELKDLNEFLGIASHELRAPLTAINANIQLAVRRLRRQTQQLMEESGPSFANLVTKIETVYEPLERAEHQVGALNRIVGDLVDASRIRQGALELSVNREPCDLVAIVSEVVRNTRLVVPKRELCLVLPFDAHKQPLSLPVRADAGRIEQVITNYLSNALRYAPEDRPIMIQIQIEALHARVSVSDQGPGLAVEEQERIWERFYRAANVYTQPDAGVGLGLGLHICRTIIEQHRGQVGVQSTPGSGATFWFTLPLVNGI